MRYAGDYPFTVYVHNLFDPNTGIVVEVELQHGRSYYKMISSEGKMYPVLINEPGPQESLISVQPGTCLAFPMYFRGDSLTFSIKGIPDYEYMVSGGFKAKIIPENLGPPVPDTYQGQGQTGNGREYYEGGTWLVDPENDNNAWKMEIIKFKHDPEEDDVAVGPATPG